VASGLLALLDDVVAISKVAAASVDDIAAQATKAGAKAAGVVVDDAAVTPRYLVGFAAQRELAIIWKIALGSLKNKIVFLLPAALFLNWAAPWSVTPLLMIGGAYLCYEGAEKLYGAIVPYGAQKHEEHIAPSTASPEELEAQKVAGAIRTDFILSAEIMAITLAATPPGSVGMQAAVLAAVALGITILVYGAVALIVKADDVGLALAASERPVASLFGLRDPGVGAPGGADRALTRLTKPLGRGLVVSMPYFLSFLSGLGVVAMAWVGGGILLHGLHEFGVHGPGHVIEVVSAAAAKMAPDLAGIISWIINAVASALFGLAAGAIMIPLAHLAAPLTRIIIGWVRRSKTPAAT
jgi:predicted DNA repair protein MutK